jgi:hypothetical protein
MMHPFKELCQLISAPIRHLRAASVDRALLQHMVSRTPPNKAAQVA